MNKALVDFLYSRYCHHAFDLKPEGTFQGCKAVQNPIIQRTGNENQPRGQGGTETLIAADEMRVSKDQGTGRKPKTGQNLPARPKGRTSFVSGNKQVALIVKNRGGSAHGACVPSLF